MNDYKRIVSQSWYSREISLAQEREIRLDEHWRTIDQVQRASREIIMPAVQAVHEVETLLRCIAGIAAVGEGERLRAALQGMDRDLNGAATDLQRCLRKVPGGPILTDSMILMVTEHVDGIQRVLTGLDRGLYLVSAVKTYGTGGLAELAALREGVGAGGAPRNEAITRLADLAIEIRGPKPKKGKVSWKRIAQVLVTRLEKSTDPKDGADLRYFRKRRDGSDKSMRQRCQDLENWVRDREKELTEKLSSSVSRPCTTAPR